MSYSLGEILSFVFPGVRIVKGFLALAVFNSENENLSYTQFDIFANCIALKFAAPLGKKTLLCAFMLDVLSTKFSLDYTCYSGLWCIPYTDY